MASRVIAVLLILAGSAVAQLDANSAVRQVRVRLAFANGSCEEGTRVTLMASSRPVAEGVTDDRCEVEFFNVPTGTYHLNVSGQTIAEGDGGTIALSSTMYADFEVKVRRPGDVQPSAGAPVGAFVSISDLAVPTRAKKEFDKANQLINKQDFGKAIDRLNSAIKIYPAYANAYNNLGVVYARMGDRAHEREALQKAISIDDHFAPAYLNLGRMNLATGDLSGAEAAFSQASSYAPADAMALVLLSYSQFMERHFDAAITTSKRAHSLPGEHAAAHEIAARAFEQKRDAAGAIGELEEFLKEESSGPRADAVRKELDAVRAIPH